MKLRSILSASSPSECHIRLVCRCAHRFRAGPRHPRTYTASMGVGMEAGGGLSGTKGTNRKRGLMSRWVELHNGKTGPPRPVRSARSGPVQSGPVRSGPFGPFGRSVCGRPESLESAAVMDPERVNTNKETDVSYVLAIGKGVGSKASLATVNPATVKRFQSASNLRNPPPNSAKQKPQAS